MAAFARIVALWVACSFGLTGVAAYVHQASFEHEVCPEHGELVHVGAHPSQPDGGEPSDRDDDGHEHCRIGPATGAAVDVELGPTTVAVLGRAGRLWSLPVRGPPFAGVDLRLAPKTSPPLA